MTSVLDSHEGARATEAPPPAETRTERVRASLRALRMSSADIIGAAAVTKDGFLIGSVLPPEIDEEMIGGIVTSVLEVGERTSEEVMCSSLEQVCVASPKGWVLVNALSDEAALVVLVGRDAKLGLIFMETKRCVNEVAQLLVHE